MTLSLKRLVQTGRGGFACGFLLLSGGAETLLGVPATPTNTDSGLQKLVLASTGTSGLVTRPALNGIMPGRFDASRRVLVHVHLDGSTPMSSVIRSIVAKNGQVLGKTATYRHGLLAAYLPSDQISAVSGLTGVRALTLEHSPIHRVGTYTSQGTTVLRTGILNNLGLKGDGITVGVLSDSFNTALQVTSSPPATTAQQDVATGDLPVVNVLEDYPQGTDEGRAMCQIVYDEAPHCHLAFATGDVSEVDFANNIVALRTQAGASVIVDDIGYLDEPMFSDGMIAQAVDTVATSTTIGGKPAVYVSAAGNDGNSGYRSPDRTLSDLMVRQAGHHGNLKLNNINPNAANYLDPSLTKGGWFNWNPGRAIEPVTTVQAPGPTSDTYLLFLQWDDPFDLDHGITTDYNFLVFDAQGNYHPELSSTTNAFQVQEPIQAIGYLQLGTNYQIAITKTRQTDPLAPPPPAVHQLGIYSSLDSESNLVGKYFPPAPLTVPIIYGHPTAQGAIAAAAYDYSWKAATPFSPELENFTTPGPSTIYFDEQLNRLPTPEVRAKPEVAGVDGVVTTFFGSPYYNFPYAFFGTSAAAPSVAGVAALMQQAAGGSGNISPATIKQALIASTLPRNSTIEQTQAAGSDATSTVSITALGEWFFSANYFTVTFTSKKADSVDQLVIDGTAAGLIFDTTQFTVGNVHGITARDISVGVSSTNTSQIVLQFKRGTFHSGTTFGFTVGQDETNPDSGYTQSEYGVGVDAEDLAYGATATASFAARGHANMTLSFQEGAPTAAFLPPDGYGRIDAIHAVSQVLPPNSPIQLGSYQ